MVERPIRPEMTIPLKRKQLHDRYAQGIPEPAPFLSWHGAPIGGLWVFLKSKYLWFPYVCISAVPAVV